MNETTNNDLERTTEAGFIALLAIAAQIREGVKGEPTDTNLLTAKLLFNKVFRNAAE